MAAGGELKRLRLNAGKSASVAASMIGVDAEKMRKWESKNVDPVDEKDIKAIENYFGVQLHELDSLETFQFIRKDAEKGKQEIEAKKPPPVVSMEEALNKLVDANKILAESTKIFAEGYNKIADTSDRLTKMLERSTAYDYQQNLSSVSSMLKNVQELVTDLALGKRFESIQEVTSFLYKTHSGTPE